MTHKSRKNSCFEVLDGLFCELEASAAKQRAEQLAARLRELGIDPES